MEVINKITIESYMVNLIDTKNYNITNTEKTDFLVDTFGLGNMLTNTDYGTTNSTGSVVNTIKEKSIFDDRVVTSIHRASYDGIAVSATTFYGSHETLNSNGQLSLSGYPIFRKSPTGTLYFNLNNSTSNTAVQLIIKSFENGTIVIGQSGSVFQCYFIFCDNAIYVLNNSSNRVRFGYLISNSMTYNRITELDKGKIYAIVPSIFGISGIVTDYYNAVVGDVEVLIFNKITHRLLGRSTSDINGKYKVDITGSIGDEVYMVLLSPTITNFQSKVVDTIILQ